MNILYSLQHLGYTIPPQADAGWIGEAGPGPSYLDPGSGGPENDFTARNTHFMTWNLLHLARMLKDAGGIPAHGNVRAEWDAGCQRGQRQPGAPMSTVEPRATLTPRERVELEFTNLLIVSAVAFAAPLALGLAPAVRLPAVVLEIVLGIVVGPSVLGWVEVDEPVAVLSVVGLAFLLFLAGLEIDFHQLRGRALRVAGAGLRGQLRDRARRCARPQGRRPGRRRRVRRDRAQRDLAGHRHPGAQGPRRGRLAVRPARDRRRDDRRLRDDHPAVAVLLARRAQHDRDA